MKCHSYLVLLVLLSVLNAQIKAQSSRTQNDVAQRVERLMAIEVGFEQMVPAGMSVETNEVSREGKSGKDLVVQYHIFLKGVPPGALFKALNWPPDAEKPSVIMEGISVGKDGILMCAGRNPEQCGDPKKPDDPIEFTVLPMKAEPSRFAFVSSDIKIGTVIVADPIEARDKGCTLSLLRLTRAFDLAFLVGTGFAPNTEVQYTVSSEMTSNFAIKADAKGRIRVAVIPFPGKKRQGTAKVRIDEATCSPEVSWEWGPI